MSAKSDRHATRQDAAAYHETQLAALVERVGAAIDRFRDGELDAFGIHQGPFQDLRTSAVRAAFGRRICTRRVPAGASMFTRGRGDSIYAATTHWA